MHSPVGELERAPCVLERGAEAASAQAGSWGLSLSHLLIFPLFCSTHKGPGQQGRKAKADGDHLRLWGVRVRGTFSTLPLRIQEQSARGTSTRGCPIKQGSVSWPFAGSAWSSSSAGMAWEPARAPSHSPRCGRLCMAVALLPGRLRGPPVCLLNVSSDKINPGSCTAACQPGPRCFWGLQL